MEDFYAIEVRTLSGAVTTLEPYRDKVLLVVNTASRCMFTPQYAELEDLQRRYASRGFSVLGFPCNQFGGQEPGAEAEIAEFCATTFGVSFPMHAKVDVNGETTHPVFCYLKERAPGLLGMRNVKWNFTKFLVARRAKSVQRFAPITRPLEIRDEIELYL